MRFCFIVVIALLCLAAGGFSVAETALHTGDVASPKSLFVTIHGAVRAPQQIPWTSDLTLLTALKRAGGIGGFASTRVKVTRNGQNTWYNFKKLRKDPDWDPKLLPGDDVEVPEY